MNNYDIGILTFWDVPNYGTFAQAYALQKACEKICPGKSVVQVNYLDRKHYNNYCSLIPPYPVTTKTFWINLPQRINPYSKYNKKKALFKAAYETIPHTDKYDASSIGNLKVSTLVLGSDIVWDYSFAMFNKDPRLFGVGINADKKISYAASFGTVKAGKKHPQYVIEGVNALDAISVRDRRSVELVKEIAGKDCELSLDPTWLWDFNNDKNVVKPDFSNYLIVYGQLFTDEFIKEIIRYAKDNNLKIICLDCNDDNYDWCDVVIKQYQLSPFQWMGMFKYADVVATSTFHGLTFSLIFNKKLAFCKSQFIMAKAGDFLQDIGLYELYCDDPKVIFSSLEKIDYKNVNDVIASKREQSLGYLIDNIQFER